MTTISEAMDSARRKLANGGIETASLDARLLLQHVAGLRHAEIVANPERPLNAGVLEKLQDLLARRQAYEPVSRILGEREFHGRIFRVTPAVLDPRPDTETLVSEALKSMGPCTRVLDLGTGSGAIIATLLAERPESIGVATDISREALAVARSNAESLGVAERVRWLHCNWFEAVSGEFDLIVSNPPYIPLSEIAGLPPSVRSFDPPRALDGGPDGLEAYRRIAAGAGAHLAPGGRIILEFGAGTEAAVGAIFAAVGFSLEASASDLAGHIRCLTFTVSKISIGKPPHLSYIPSR